MAKTYSTVPTCVWVSVCEWKLSHFFFSNIWPEKVILLLQRSFFPVHLEFSFVTDNNTAPTWQPLSPLVKNTPLYFIAIRQIHVRVSDSESNGCVLLQELQLLQSGQKAWGSGGQKPKTPNVYYYPVSRGLAFKRESPTVTLGPTVRLPPCCNFCPSPISHLRSGNVDSRIKEHKGILCEQRLGSQERWRLPKQYSRFGPFCIYLYVWDWQMSEKYTSQLFVVQWPTHGPELSLQSSFISSSTFFHSSPPFFSSLQSFLLPHGSGATLLPVGTVDNKHPRCAPCAAPRGPARAHLHPRQWQQGPSVHQTCFWKNLFWEINTRTCLQPQSGPGSKVKEPRFLSRQTGAQRHLPTSTQPPPPFFSLFAEQQRMSFLMDSCVYDSFLAAVAHLGAH